MKIITIIGLIGFFLFGCLIPGWGNGGQEVGAKFTQMCDNETNFCNFAGGAMTINSTSNLTKISGTLNTTTLVVGTNATTTTNSTCIIHRSPSGSGVLEVCDV